MQVREMICTHSYARGNTADAPLRCVEECYGCAQTCIICADACLGEDMVQQLTQCIRLNLDCADMCAATGAAAMHRTGSNIEVLRAAIQARLQACRDARALPDLR